MFRSNPTHHPGVAGLFLSVRHLLAAICWVIVLGARFTLFVVLPIVFLALVALLYLSAKGLETVAYALERQRGRW